MMTPTGTLHYKSPEMFELNYNETCDVWAVGVTAYQLITGKLPFNHLTKDKTEKLIKNRIYLMD